MAYVLLAASASMPMIAAGPAAIEKPKGRSSIRRFFAKVFRPFRPNPKGYVIPARAVRQFPPTVPEDVSRQIEGEIPIDLKVSVNERGGVTRIQPVTAKGGLHADLARRASEAVRRWQFSPAKVNDRYVRGEMTVHFRFRSSGVQWN